MKVLYSFTFCLIVALSFNNIKTESEIGIIEHSAVSVETPTENEDQFSVVRNITCNSVNCPLPNACLNSYVCECGKGYANFVDPKDPNSLTIYCNYERKKQLTAFLLQFFFPLLLGIGHFYVGNIWFGIPEIIISACFWVSLYLIARRKKGSL